MKRHLTQAGEMHAALRMRSVDALLVRRPREGRAFALRATAKIHWRARFSGLTAA